MTRELEKAIQHIKTRADAWAVKEVTEALQSISERLDKALSQEPCDKCKYFDGNSCQHYDYKVGYTKGYEDASNRFGQEPCEDAISRDAVIKAVDAHTNEDGTLDDDISVILEELPFVTQTPKYWIDKDNKIYKMPDDIPHKSGKWIEIDDEPHEVWECDHCGFVIDGSGCIEPYEYRDTYNYCPNCGAKMESEG